jgi:hypothetical protein
MNCKPHKCAICGQEKYHGAVCVVKGEGDISFDEWKKQTFARIDYENAREAANYRSGM